MLKCHIRGAEDLRDRDWRRPPPFLHRIQKRIDFHIFFNLSQRFQSLTVKNAQ